MGQSAPIRHDRIKLHINGCKSSFTGSAKRGLFAYSRGSRRHEKCGVQLKHTAPRKRSHVDQSTQCHITQKCLHDDNEIQEIIRKISYSDDSGIVRRRFDSLSSVTFSVQVS
uniref:Ovule protein n=1 Tax=Mesocestoides corti TaxID=53468 RepID=A0A5K3G688_MESCO